MTLTARISQQIGLALVDDALAHPTITASILVMDRSTSMRRYGDLPMTAMNRHITKLAESSQAETIAAMIVTFAAKARIEIPMRPVREIQRIDRYTPEHGSRVVGTLLGVMQAMSASLAAGPQDRVNVVLSVFTDGEDNGSPAQARSELKALAAQAIAAGWDLCTYGLGHPASVIAASLGFPVDFAHAFTVEATDADFAQSVHHATSRIIITAQGVAVPSEGPVTHSSIAPSSH